MRRLRISIERTSSSEQARRAAEAAAASAAAAVAVSGAHATSTSATRGAQAPATAAQASPGSQPGSSLSAASNNGAGGSGIGPGASPLLRGGEMPRRGGFAWGYVVTLGVLAAIVTGLALYNLRSIVFSIFFAGFITVGLDPLIRWLQRRHFARGWALFTVILLVVAAIVAVIWLIVPIAVEQISSLAVSIPSQIEALQASGWFDTVDAATNGLLGQTLSSINDIIADPKTWAAVGSGVVGFGAAIADAVSTGIFTVILTIYFIATYDSTKEAAFRMVAKSHRATFASYTNRILENVGKYLSGMVILAFINSIFSTILLTLVGVPGAFFIGIAAFFITLIPLVGTIITTCIMTIVAFFQSPVSALIVLLVMLVYMQVEAYLFTPKVMSKAVQVPGSVVLISALAGGTLFGLAGALIAIPISAGVILIIRELVMPRKELS
ncbi:AI-2E family transporter [Okibacterium fritillariae]|uniref:Predicted PurR-regulated permease PerM n=1 Tax=Okibacterium fritillariae TaxID=123320 RepID=A0A1T5IJJ0_9MICO|nr:AI-2E family transporter [Okibacterium fritillariae]SKC39198.1 Predicted PurR-regulated permease PerM [Okibacterium fritillariae]